MTLTFEMMTFIYINDRYRNILTFTCLFKKFIVSRQNCKGKKIDYDRSPWPHFEGNNINVKKLFDCWNGFVIIILNFCMIFFKIKRNIAKPIFRPNFTNKLYANKTLEPYNTSDMFSNRTDPLKLLTTVDWYLSSSFREVDNRC